MSFGIGLVFAAVQILKKVRLLQNDVYHKVKMALSLELSGIFQ